MKSSTQKGPNLAQSCLKVSVNVVARGYESKIIYTGWFWYNYINALKSSEDRAMLATQVAPQPQNCCQPPAPIPSRALHVFGAFGKSPYWSSQLQAQASQIHWNSLTCSTQITPEEALLVEVWCKYIPRAKTFLKTHYGLSTTLHSTIPVLRSSKKLLSSIGVQPETILLDLETSAESPIRRIDLLISSCDLWAPGSSSQRWLIHFVKKGTLLQQCLAGAAALVCCAT